MIKYLWFDVFHGLVSDAITSETGANAQIFKLPCSSYEHETNDPYSPDIKKPFHTTEQNTRP